MTKGVNLFDNKNLLNETVERSAYSDRMSWILAQMSKLAYKDSKTIKSELKNTNFYLEKIIEKDKIQFILVRCDSYAILAFRGTKTNIKNFLTDIDIRFYDYDDGEYHRGFFTAYLSLEKYLNEVINETNLRVPLYICGHSLGGALAVIASKYLDYPYIMACYTYGCPKIGKYDPLFVHIVPIYRCVNKNDIVTKVPLSILGYRSYGVQKYFSVKNNLHTHLGFVSSFYHFFKNVFSKHSGFISDHDIDEYIFKTKVMALKMHNKKVQLKEEIKKLIDSNNN